MGYKSSSIDELENGLFRVTLTYTGLLYGTFSEHESFKTIEECKEWIILKRSPELTINHIQKKITIPEAPKATKLKLYKDDV